MIEKIKPYLGVAVVGLLCVSAYTHVQQSNTILELTKKVHQIEKDVLQFEGHKLKVIEYVNDRLEISDTLRKELSAIDKVEAVLNDESKNRCDRAIGIHAVLGDFEDKRLNEKFLNIFHINNFSCEVSKGNFSQEEMAKYISEFKN